MRNYILLAATAAALLAGTAVGHADTLAGGPLPPASSSGFALVTCTLFNAGPTAVPLTSAAIVGLNGQPVSLLTNPTTPPKCGTSIAAGQGCVIQAAVAGNTSFTCVTTTTGSDASVRGSLAIGVFGGAPAMVAVPLQATAASPGPSPGPKSP
ncbi:MAG: hypothetical protein ACJ8H8_02935 [Geminicoccaceae bacterium]